MLARILFVLANSAVALAEPPFEIANPVGVRLQHRIGGGERLFERALIAVQAFDLPTQPVHLGIALVEDAVAIGDAIIEVAYAILMEFHCRVRSRQHFLEGVPLGVQALSDGIVVGLVVLRSPGAAS